MASLALLFAFLFPDFAQLLAVATVAGGLPVGFIWVYALYHPTIWKRSNDGRDWRELLTRHIGRDLIRHIHQVRRLSALQRRNLARLQNAETRFIFVDRLSAQLREEYPFLAFFHVRHHTLRNLAYVLKLDAFVYFVFGALMTARQALCCNALSYQLFSSLLLLVAAIFLWLIGDQCLSQAHDSYLTARRTYGLRFAELRTEIAERASVMLRAPFFAEIIEY